MNLSILIVGGKETKKDSPSNREWRGILLKVHTLKWM
jgi:hypothetical protein